MPVAQLHNMRLNYRLEGRADAPLLVLCHSVGLDHSMWDQQIADFSRHFRILRFDFRGHGASMPPRDVSITTLGRDVLELTCGLGYDTFSICGLSLGGMVALWIAAHAAIHVDRLVICNTGTRFPTPPGGWEARFDKIRREGVASLADPMMERFFSEPYRNMSTPFFHTMRTVFASNDAEGLISGFCALRDADLDDLPAKVSGRTLVVVGDQGEEGGRALAAQIKGAQFIALPAGHISAVEAPAQFNAALLGFLTAR